MELIDTTAKDITTNRAWEVHCEVMAGKRQAVMGIYEMARALKQMRDEKLYGDLGYEDFPAYCQNAAKVNATQAYKYIKVYEELGGTALQSAGVMGIEKLYMVLSLPFDEKNEALENPEKIEGMSVAELKEFIANAKGQAEQISFLQEELDNRMETIDELKEQMEEAEGAEDADTVIARIRDEYEQKLKQASLDSAKEIAAVREAAQKERDAAVDAEKARMKGKYQDEIAKIRADQAAEAKKAVDKAVEKIREEAAEAARAKAEAEAKDELARLRAAVEDAAGEKAALEKRLKLSDGAMVTFKLYAGGIQDNYNKLVQHITTLDGEQAAECRAALRKLVGALYEMTGKLVGEDEE